MPFSIVALAQTCQFGGVETGSRLAGIAIVGGAVLHSAQGGFYAVCAVGLMSEVPVTACFDQEDLGDVTQDILTRVELARADVVAARLDCECLEARLRDVNAARSEYQADLAVAEREIAVAAEVAERRQNEIASAWRHVIDSITVSTCGVAAGRSSRAAVVDALWREVHTKASTIAVLARRCNEAEAELSRRDSATDGVEGY
eukprot:TRINITY_DN69999_c0_g1_i1.p1 TRINITY_DN69999_c0_g1~~TRINITY_DN69999_c0_g1_i1.p1  ORF type:complete len:202 (-),score=35.57 TRINITY_DN69999_c0_g1_i1:73-678(-)